MLSNNLFSQKYTSTIFFNKLQLISDKSTIYIEKQVNLQLYNQQFDL